MKQIIISDHKIICSNKTINSYIINNQNNTQICFQLDKTFEINYDFFATSGKNKW